jgi:hypothetical protein
MAALKMERCRQAEERRLAAHGLAPVERFVFLPGLGRRERVLEVGAESGPRLRRCGPRIAADAPEAAEGALY